MEYAQLNQDGSFSHQITTTGNVEWDANHFCPAWALTPAEAAQFRVVPFDDIPKPEHDRIIRVAVRDGGEFVGGKWQTKWRIDPRFVQFVDGNGVTQTVAAQEAAAVAEKTAADLAELADAYDDALKVRIIFKARKRKFRGLAEIGVRAGYANPRRAKAIEFMAWVDACEDHAESLVAAAALGGAPATIADFLAGLPSLADPA